VFDSTQELLDKIRLGEDSFLELKEVRFTGERVSAPHRDSIADELAAFANARGGVLILGIDDKTRDILGIPVKHLDLVERFLFEICAQRVDPPLAPEIQRLWLPSTMGEVPRSVFVHGSPWLPSTTGEELAVLKIEVPRSLFVHGSPGGYLHRVGSSKRKLPSDYLARLFQQRSQARLIRFDETPVPRATLTELDEPLWRRFGTPRSIDTPEQLLAKLAMASQEDTSTWRPTVAGILMACREPERFLPGAFIQAVAYQGSVVVPQAGSTYQRDARDIAGPLDQQIFAACDFVRKNMWIAARKSQAGGREDLPQYDLLAVFEAITNAVAHRDYSMAGSKVRLRLFDDRLELYTPGLLPNTMTPESLAYRQASRNEAITSLLARCPVPVDRDEFASHRLCIMDKRGEGVPIILARSEQLSGKTPEYRLIDESELVLTIYAADVS